MPILPTLSKMAEVYRLSREGGSKSPRFTEYVRLGREGGGLSLYNPMAGPAALEAIQSLLEMDAEALALEELEAMQTRLSDHNPITLALVVASKGMWTDRLGTEVEYRTKEDREPASGIVYLWSREVTTELDVRREAAAEAIRVIWTLRNGQATSLYRALAREGLAYAPSLNPHAQTSTADESVRDAISILGDSSNHGEIVAVLYGDEAAQELGFAPVGLAQKVGYAWAAHAMNQRIEQLGAVGALEAPMSF